MATKRQTGQMVLAMVVGVACLNGCSHTPTAASPAPDPILGNFNPPGIPAPNSATKPPPTPTTLNPVMPPPGSELTSTNNATLAGMSGSQLGRPLAIDNEGRVQPTGQLTSGSWAKPEAPGYPGYNPNPKVEKVPDIEPTTAKSAPNGWQGPPSAQPVNAALPAQPANLTEQVTRQLQERGVINQKIEPLATGVHLTCYMTLPTGRPRILEATAVDYVTAAQAILHQLDNAR